MTPPTVNAYYNPSMNDINFPAGVLLPPLYDPKMDDAPNYGNTGGTIGHELTHGFDDSGPPVRRRRGTCATGGRRTMRRTSSSVPSASAISTRNTSLSMTSRSTAR